MAPRKSVQSSGQQSGRRRPVQLDQPITEDLLKRLGVTIDPETHDIVQNVYMRKVERVDGDLWNIEFETFEAVKDPGKADS